MYGWKGTGHNEKISIRKDIPLLNLFNELVMAKIIW